MGKSGEYYSVKFKTHKTSSSFQKTVFTPGESEYKTKGTGVHSKVKILLTYPINGIKNICKNKGFCEPNPRWC